MDFLNEEVNAKEALLDPYLLGFLQRILTMLWFVPLTLDNSPAIETKERAKSVLAATEGTKEIYFRTER